VINRFRTLSSEFQRLFRESSEIQADDRSIRGDIVFDRNKSKKESFYVRRKDIIYIVVNVLFRKGSIYEEAFFQWFS